MPQPDRLLKAEMREISWDEQQNVKEEADPFPVQFNPETLKVAYANQSAGGDQRGGSAIQYVGKGSTKLTFDLWFDVTAPPPHEPQESEDDVRRLTKKIVDFIKPKDSGKKDKFIPPGVRFLWGTFLFEGIMDSVNESLEFFSEEGKPLRASVSCSLSKQDIQFQFGNQTGPGLGSEGTPGTEEQQTAKDGDSVQSMSARQGDAEGWQERANQNDIDQPRNVPAGTPLQ